jgi:hypothetical protein
MLRLNQSIPTKLMYNKDDDNEVEENDDPDLGQDGELTDPDGTN